MPRPPRATRPRRDDDREFFLNETERKQMERLGYTKKKGTTVTKPSGGLSPSTAAAVDAVIRARRAARKKAEARKAATENAAAQKELDRKAAARKAAAKRK